MRDQPATALRERTAPAGVELTPLPRLKVDGRTSAALTCGVAGLFMFNVIFGPIAIFLGLTSLRRGPGGRSGRPAALLGVVLGVADLVLFAVLLAARVNSGQGWTWELGV